LGLVGDLPSGLSVRANSGQLAGALVIRADELRRLPQGDGRTRHTAGGVRARCSGSAFPAGVARQARWAIGWIAIVAGVFTLLGQVPALQPLFMVANIAYIAWYIGIGRRFWRMAGRDA